MNLYMCDFDKEYEVIKVNMPSNLKAKIYSLGVSPGVKIKKIYKSIFNDPTAYEVKLTTVALRNNDAKYIEVKECE